MHVHIALSHIHEHSAYLCTYCLCCLLATGHDTVGPPKKLSIYQTLCLLVHQVDRSVFTTWMTQFTEY